MQKMFMMTAIAVVSFSMSLCAQQKNTDSLSLVSKISTYQLKLAKLQNMLDKKRQDKRDAAIKAQESADKNKRAAGDLSDNSMDKKDAREADKAASDARRDAKRARKASDDLDDLNKAIDDLTNKIANEQAKLNRYTLAPSPVTVPLPVQPDTTIHN